MLDDRDDPPPYRLDRNENPFPPLAEVAIAAGEAVRSIARYPDDSHAELIASICTRLGVPPEHVVIGAGATAIIQHLLLMTVADRRGVIFSWPSAQRYQALADASRADQRLVPLVGSSQDLDAMAAAVDRRSGLIIIGHPHDPTGAAADRSSLTAFLDQVPRRVLVVLDEEYAEFVRDPEVPSGLDLYHRWPNVVVVRTFSKAYGLAGLRIGFAVTNAAIASRLRRVATPFGVSTIAERAAVAALGASEQMIDRVGRLVAERERMTTALRRQGHELTDSEGNFLWLPMPEGRSREFAQACRHHGIAVAEVWEAGIRLTVAEPEANNVLIFVAAAFAGT